MLTHTLIPLVRKRKPLESLQHRLSRPKQEAQLRPDLVDMSYAERRVPEQLAANAYVRFGGRVSFGWLSNDFNPDGYVGDPTPANADLGKQLFEGAVRAFGEALREIAAFDFGR